MASRKRKNKRRKGSKQDLPPETLLRAGRLREAVKGARAAFNAAGDEASSHLLQAALAARAANLESRGMPDNARSLVEEALALPFRADDLVERLRPVMLRLGMAEQVRDLAGASGADEGDGDTALEAELADEAVRDPATVPASMPGMVETARRVRRALEQVEAGEDEEARELVADIPRRSPFAAWNRFVRGLCPFYAGDVEGARRQWDRLDPGRKAGRIAARLLALGAPLAPDNEPAVIALEKALGRPPRVAKLAALRESVNARRWPQARATALELAETLDPAQRRRLTAAVYDDLLDAAADARAGRGEMPRELGKLLETLPPPEIDPTWDRFHALVWQRVEAPAIEVLGWWEEYARALVGRRVFGDRSALARAMVLHHMAGLVLGEGVKGGGGLGDQLDDDEVALMEAEPYLEQAIESAPDFLPAYERLMTLYERTGDTAAQIRAGERLLERDPDHVETHRTLALAARPRDPERALRHAKRLVELAPLDRGGAATAYECAIDLARAEAEAGRIEPARERVAEAESLAPALVQVFTHPAVKSMIEQKAGHDEAAEALRSASKEQAPDEGAWHLAMAVWGEKWQMPAAAVKRHRRAWKKTLKGRTDARRAAEMARFLEPVVANEGRVGRDAHRYLKPTFDYLRRSAATAKYDRAQMAEVCGLMIEVLEWLKEDDDWALAEEAWEAAERLGSKACRLFPDLPEGAWLDTKAEVLAAGADRLGHPGIMDSIRYTLDLVEGSDAPRHRRIATEAGALLAFVHSPMGPLGGFMEELSGLGPDSLAGLAERMAEMLGGAGAFPDEDEDEDEAEDEAPWPREPDDQPWLPF